MSNQTALMLTITTPGKTPLPPAFLADFDRLFPWFCDDEGNTFWAYNVWTDEDDLSMRLLSRKYPDFFFELNGEGETGGDMWNRYFQNGKMQLSQAEITYPPYREEEMAFGKETGADLDAILPIRLPPLPDCRRGTKHEQRL